MQPKIPAVRPRHFALGSFLLGLAAALALLAGVGQVQQRAPGVIHALPPLNFGVAIAQSATTNSGALTVTPNTCTINLSTKDMVCSLQYSVTSTSGNLDSRFIRIPGNNGAILDDVTQNQIAASVPSGISTGRDSMVTGINSAVTSGAAAGKLDR